MKRILTAAMCGSLCAAPLLARAEDVTEPAEQREVAAVSPRSGRVAIAALGGSLYGWRDFTKGVENLATAYGVRAGYTGGSTPVYLGGTLLHFIHQPGGGRRTDAVALSFELGADVRAGDFTLRPFLAIGGLASVFEDPPNGSSALGAHAALAVLAKYAFGPVELGVEARYESLIQPYTSTSLLGSAGVVF